MSLKRKAFQLKRWIRLLENEALLISSIENIAYFTNYTNFSAEEREGYLFISKDLSYVITDGRYTEAVKAEAADFVVIEINIRNPWHKVIQKLIKLHKINVLGIEETNLTVKEYKKISKISPNLVEIKTDSLRVIKTDQELDAIKSACKMGDQVFEFILKKLKVGISEKQVAWEMEKFIQDRGLKFSFEPIVAFGSNAAVPHHQTGDKKLTTQDELILMDFGVRVKNYCSDMTRTVFIGKPSEAIKKMYRTVLKAQQKSIKFISGKLKAKEAIEALKVDLAAREYIKSHGYPNMPHSLGHGVGIEIHEAPRLSPSSRDYLTEGMVFSIEPGIYLPGYGGVRIEDLVTIQKGKLEILTKSAKELIVIPG